MSEQDSAQERTEEATPKRHQDAKDKGDIARSKELNTMAILMAGTGGLLVFGDTIANGLKGIFASNLTFTRADVFEVDAMVRHLSASIVEGAYTLLPLFIVLLLAALIGPIALGGWVLSGKSLQPKFSRIDPLAGLKRMFSARALMELLKATAKFLLVSLLAVVILYALTPEILAIGKQDVQLGTIQALWLVGWAVLGMSAATILIAALDIPFQLWDHTRKLKMTRQEIKDEHKSTEGKPEVKSRIRQLQYEMSQRRMMAAVPQADVVITNPEHYAIALRYNSNDMHAPVLVAKGADHVAQKIREVAKAHDVPILSAPPLARAVFYNTELDEQIPAGLYIAVAQVLAYVFQLRRHGKRKAGVLPELPIPDALRRDQ